jgi:hypothetical protein
MHFPVELIVCPFQGTYLPELNAKLFESLFTRRDFNREGDTSRQRPKKSPFVETQVPTSHLCQSGGFLDPEAHNVLARSHWAVN